MPFRFPANILKKFAFLLPGLAWGAFVFIAFKYMRHAIHDGDTWWHLSAGRYMWETRSFPRTDMFSHTIPGAQWINFEWLSELAMYGLVKYFGLVGLWSTKVFLGMTVLGLLVFTLVRLGARGYYLFLLAWLGYHLLQVRLCTRVELISLILMPVFLLLVLTIKNTGERQRKILPWMFFGLMVVWCNAHGGFIYGLLMVVLLDAGARLAKWPVSAIASLDRTIALLFVAILITPFGPRITTMFAQTYVDFRTAGQWIAEWDSPTVRSVPFFWILFMTAGALSASAVIKRKAKIYFWIPAVIVFAVVGSSYFRTTALLTFLALPMAAEALGKNRWTNLKAGSEPLIWILSWSLCLGLIAIDRDWLLKPLPPGIVDWNTTPKGACDFVRRENIDGTMYNSYGYGGYIEWALGPARKVFMDGRYIFYPLLSENQERMSGKPNYLSAVSWQEYFNGHGVDYAVTKYEPLRIRRSWDLPFKHESIMNLMFPRETWALVYWDDAAMVFLKRVSKFSDAIARNELRVLTPYDIVRMANVISAKKLRKEDIRKELENYEKKIGPTWRGNMIRAMLDQI